MGQGVLIRPAAVLWSIAEAVGTPTYVYDADQIVERYRDVETAFRGIPYRIHYSVKANSNLAVLGLLRAAGAGADIVSGGELYRVRRAGFVPGDVVYSGAGKRVDELEAALGWGVGLTNVESAAELEVVASMARRLEVVARVGVRVNPDVRTDTHPYHQTGAAGMKFGIPTDEAARVALAAHQRDELELVSVGIHIGSQILDPSRYALGAETLSGLVRDLRASGVDTLGSVGLGGGWGIRYRDEEPLAPEAVAEVARRLFAQTGLPILIEPGRFLVGNAGILLTRCLYCKHSGGREFTVVDAGMSDLMRPSLYGAYHEIVLVKRSGTPNPAGPIPGASHGVGARVDIVGPLCESGDFLGLDRAVEGVAPGALLAVLDAGAYGFSMTSNYNSRPRPAEVMVYGDRWVTVRERERNEDMVRGERTLDEIEGVATWMETERP